MEFDGELTREDAERAAWALVSKRYRLEGPLVRRTRERYSRTMKTPSDQGRSHVSTLAEYAVRELENADRLDVCQPLGIGDRVLSRVEAARSRADADRFLDSVGRLVGSPETELVPAPREGDAVPNVRRSYLCTLADPNSISVDASEHRTALLARTGVLSAGLDTATSARAHNSIEKTLCYQMAAVNAAGMELLIRALEHPTAPPAETARLYNVAARLFETYQSGCDTLLKLKNRGRQRVVVQHQQVNVGSGGQAVVAGTIKPGSRRRGTEAKS